MKKEIICHVATDEEGEFAQVRRVMANPNFLLLSLGQSKMVVKLSELIEAVEAIHQYSGIFDLEEKRRVEPSKPSQPPSVASSLAAAQSKLNETGELEFTFELRTEPTDSELALIKDLENLNKG